MEATVRAQKAPRSSGGIWEGPYILRKWAYFWAILVVVAWGTPSSFGLLICGGVALHSLRGPRQTVEALGILAFLIVFGKTGISLGRWLVLFGAAGRTIWDGFFGGESVPRILYPLFFFFFGVFALSILASRFPVVSGLKVTSFTVGVGVTITAFYRTRHLRDYWLSWIFTLSIFILLASIPFYGLGPGYARNGAGFQGILTHPQTFGPVAASITAFLTGLYFFRDRTHWIVLLCVGLGWLGVYFSLSRTALLALLLAGGTAAAIGVSFKPDTWSADLAHTLNRPLVLVSLFAVLSLSALQWTAIQSKLESFLAKRGGGDVSLVQTLERSRGNLMSRSMVNFWEKPITGIGFGAPSDPSRFEGHLERGPFGIPLSASVEKGFMPTAVLEETGLVGAALTLLLLFFLFAPVVQHSDPTLFWVMGTCLFVNFGEMVFFSIGGMGFFLWFLIAFCHVAALDRNGRWQAATIRVPARASRGAR